MFSSNLQPLHELGKLDELMPCLLFITREIFPVFHKWRYYDFSRREQVGEFKTAIAVGKLRWVSARRTVVGKPCSTCKLILPGQKSLEVFHKVLNIFGPEKTSSTHG